MNWRRAVVVGIILSAACAMVALGVHNARVQQEAEARQVQEYLARQKRADEEYWQRQVAETRARTDEMMRRWGYCSHHGGTYLRQAGVCIKAEEIPIPEEQ